MGLWDVASSGAFRSILLSEECLDHLLVPSALSPKGCLLEMFLKDKDYRDKSSGWLAQVALPLASDSQHTYLRGCSCQYSVDSPQISHMPAGLLSLRMLSPPE